MSRPVSYLTVDAVLISGSDEVLLVRRKYDPFQGWWALPGGFVDPDEKTLAAVEREVMEETGISGVPMVEIGTYCDPGRDPRGRTISVVYVTRIDQKPHTTAGDDAADCRWFPLNDLPEMAFDHGKILDDVKRRLPGFTADSSAFLPFLQKWMSELRPVFLHSILSDYPPDQTALVSVDVINGFCKSGNLFSPRVGRIVTPVVELFRKAKDAGIRHFLLLQDNHPVDSKEFQLYPSHCVQKTPEAETVRELLDLPFSGSFQVLPKTTTNPGLEESFTVWLTAHPEVRQFLVVGDCTDICVYLLATFLKCWSVKRRIDSSIIVPADCVDTFDIPVNSGPVMPHPADFLHAVFLYHMQINGIRIVSHVE